MKNCLEASAFPLVADDEIRTLKESLLRCLRLVAAARPHHECDGTSISARTFDAIPQLIRALELDLPSEELRPLFYVFNGLMGVRDVRTIYSLEGAGLVPVGLEDETYHLLNKMSAHLTPVVVLQTSRWKRALRIIWRAMQWLNGE